MVDRKFYRCEVCSQLIILREQLSDENLTFSFSFYCGKCFASFSGIRTINGVIINEDGSIIKPVKMSNEGSKPNKESAFVFEISSEFPVESGYFVDDWTDINSWDKHIVSPFMRSTLSSDEDEFLYRKAWMDNFNNNKNNFMYYEEYENHGIKDKYKMELFNLAAKRYSSDLNTVNLTNEAFPGVAGIKGMTEKRFFNFIVIKEIITMFFRKEQDKIYASLNNIKNMMSKIFPPTSFDTFISFLDSQNFFETFAYRDDKAIKLIHENRQKFLPALVATFLNSSESISTFSIKELLNMYCDLYELLLKNYDLLIFISNFEIRSDFFKFDLEHMDYTDGNIKLSGRNISNGTKAKFISENKLDISLNFILENGDFDNDIRNGNYHNDYKYNPIKEKITFSSGFSLSKLDLAKKVMTLVKSEVLMHEVIWFFKEMYLLKQLRK